MGVVQVTDTHKEEEKVTVTGPATSAWQKEIQCDWEQKSVYIHISLCICKCLHATLLNWESIGQFHLIKQRRGPRDSHQQQISWKYVCTYPCIYRRKSVDVITATFPAVSIFLSALEIKIPSVFLGIAYMSFVMPFISLLTVTNYCIILCQAIPSQVNNIMR